MKLAIDLARKGAGKVSPNPMVGAVLVRNQEIIGTGFHQKFGGAHAEVNAIGDCDASGATLYVTLEPCNHFWKTPPCTNLILEKKIRRVVFGSIDPNPKMSGKSVEKLRAKGVQVDFGVCKELTDNLNRFYNVWAETKSPFVTVKLALSKDGFYAKTDGFSQWISGSKSRKDVHKMRAEFDAVMVGTNTIIADNPELTVRHVEGRNPNRIVLDRAGKIPPTQRIFDDNGARVFYFTTKSITDFPEHVEIVWLENRDFRLKNILGILGEMGQISVLVEGGGNLAKSFISENLWHEFLIYCSPKLLKNGLFFDFNLLEKQAIHRTKTRSGDDVKIRLLNDFLRLTPQFIVVGKEV